MTHTTPNGIRTEFARTPFAPIEVPTEVSPRHGKQVKFSTHLQSPPANRGDASAAPRPEVSR